MSTNISLANVGTSLNFDGQALQKQQEAEIEREEQLQQNEVRHGTAVSVPYCLLCLRAVFIINNLYHTLEQIKANQDT